MEYNKLGVEEAPITAGTRVLVRVDFNVPLGEHGEILDDTRMVDSLPTIKYCLDKNAKVILCSHFGRPEGKRDPQYSLLPVAGHLQTLLPGVTVKFVDDCVGEAVEKAVRTLRNGEVLLLENTRFHAEETKNDPAFAKQLAQLGDVFVSDAFGAVHRAHASTVGIADYLPAYAGMLVAKEIKYLSQVINHPKRPFTVIIGGKKVEDKLPIVENLVDTADNILLAGKLAGEWTYDTKGKRARVLVAPDAEMDIHPETVEEWRPIIQGSKTIFWNGPVGKYERPGLDWGTHALAEIIQNTPCLSVAGGGDTLASTKDYHFTHKSTGGGASLEFVQGMALPGLMCLLDKGVK